MTLPRLQLFEFNDAPWAPAPLRDALIDALSLSLDWGRVLAGVVAPFGEFMAATGAHEVLDLCSGSGGPALILARELARAGQPVPRFLLTDLFPRVPAWEQARAQAPQAIDFVPQAVDATALPPELGAGRPRVIINALHHFRPALARAVVQDAVAHAPGLFIAEGVVRNPLRFVAMAPMGLSALALGPLLASHDRLARALLTWASPAALLASTWDGCVSALRSYTPDELRAFAGPAGDTFQWRHGTFSFGGVGQGTYWWGTKSVEERDA